MPLFPMGYFTNSRLLRFAFNSGTNDVDRNFSLVLIDRGWQEGFANEIADCAVKLGALSPSEHLINIKVLK